METNLETLVMNTLDQKPLDFEVAFNNLIVDRLRNAIEYKKIQIAKQIYVYKEPESEE